MNTDIQHLVGNVYDALSDPTQWNAFLASLTRSMGANAARMRMLDNRGSCYSLVAGAGHDKSYDVRYEEHYHRVDVWNPVLNRQAPGELFHSHKVIPYGIFRKSEIYNDFYRDYDMFYGLGGNIAKSDGIIARIGIHRSRSQGEYGAKEVDLLQTLMPHLMRAFKLGSHMESLQARAEGMEAALYHSPSPLILIDEHGQVAFTSRRAEALLGSESGLSVHHNRLMAVSNTEQQQLQQLLQQAVATGARKGAGSGGAMRLTTATGEQRHNLLITPYPDRSVSCLGHNRRICAAIFIHDSRQGGSLPAELIKALYELTPSEIRLAEAILEGLTPGEAAASFGVSVNTTRSQLRSLFAKTDTQRQAELVRLLSGLANRNNHD